MAEVIRFAAPLPPVKLRRNSATHQHNYRAALVREYQETVWCGGWSKIVGAWHEHREGISGSIHGHHLPWEKAHVRLTWRHAGVAPDTDNALASCKALIDVLKATGPRPLGLFIDDSPEHMTVELTTCKVAKRTDEGVDVEVIRGRVRSGHPCGYTCETRPTTTARGSLRGTEAGATAR
jgi:hypothetical protein